MRRPIAVLAALTMVGGLLLTAPGSASAAPGGWLARINGFRAQYGLGPVVEDAAVTAIAQAWTQHMVATNTLAHNPFLAQQLPASITRSAENAGYNVDEATLFRAFTTSSQHRANLLGPFNVVGIGQVVSGGRIWTTHDFGLSSAAGPAAAPPGTTVTAAGRSTGGLWTATSTGTVAARAGAPTFGQLAVTPNRPVVGMAGTPSGGGYWLVGSDGGIFAFGDAAFSGSAGTFRLNQPVVGMASSPTGRGYWLVAADGGIFAFGDAAFSGSAGTFRLNQPIVGMASSPTGRGYWLVAADGGIFAFGDARFAGSAGSFNLASPIAGVTRSPTGLGYRLVASDGGIFSFGDAPFYGSLGGTALTHPVVAMAGTPTGRGYWLVKANGTTQHFGDAPRA